jgi:hypothetical protein
MHEHRPILSIRNTGWLIDLHQCGSATFVSAGSAETEEDSMLAPRRPVIAAVWNWWHDPSRRGQKRSDGGNYSPDDVKSVPREADESGFAIGDIATHGSFEVSLLLRRMAMLHIELDELAREEPVLFRDLQVSCVVCQCKGRCRWGLAHELDDPAWQDWRDYCPNATTLSLLSAVQMCSSNRFQ